MISPKSDSVNDLTNIMSAALLFFLQQTSSDNAAGVEEECGFLELPA